MLLRSGHVRSGHLPPPATLMVVSSPRGQPRRVWALGMAVVRLPHSDSTFSKGRSPLVVEAPPVFLATCSVPIRLEVGWGRAVGRRWPRPGGGFSGASGRGLRGFRGGGGGLPMPPAAWQPPWRPPMGPRGCRCGSPRRCAPCAPLLAFPLPRPTSPSGRAPVGRGQTTRRGGLGPRAGGGLRA